MPVFHPGVPGFKGLPVGSEAEKEALRRVLDLCAEEYAQRTLTAQELRRSALVKKVLMLRKPL